MENAAGFGDVPAGHTASRPYAPSSELFAARSLDAIAARLVRVKQGRELATDLIGAVKDRLSILRQVQNETDAILNGHAGAIPRLRLLLSRPVSAAPRLPKDLPREVVGRDARSAPNVANGEVLLRMIAGTIGAAAKDQADAMLDALGALLEPVLVLEIVAHALDSAEAGDHKALGAIATAWTMGSLDPKLDLTGPAAGGDLHAPRPGGSFDRWDFLDWFCFLEVHKVMSEVDFFGSRYVINSISDNTACPGKKITIRGHNFGTDGRVVFPEPDADDPAFLSNVGADGLPRGVTASRWTDTEIDVVVPPWATSGELQLNVSKTRIDACATIDLFRLGNPFLFQGGLSTIFEVLVNGVSVFPDPPAAPVVLEPGKTATLGWRATSHSNVKVHARILASGISLWSNFALPGGTNTTSFTVPDPKEPAQAVLEISAVGPCGETQPREIPIVLCVIPQLAVQWIEVTQGIQRNGFGVGVGNSMPLVASKDTGMRVHLSCVRDNNWCGSFAENITGSLKIDNQPLLMASNAGHCGFARVSRDDTALSTLNFLIPAAYVPPGPHTFTVRVICPDTSGRVEIGISTTDTWASKSPVQVRCAWLGTYESDTESNLLQFAQRALDYLPTPLTGIGFADPSLEVETYDLTDSDGWDDLIDDLEDAWDDADEATGVRWLALVPPTRPMGTILGKAATPGIAAASAGNRPDAAAHELSHTYGLNHVNQPPGVPAGPYDAVEDAGLQARPQFDVRNQQVLQLPAGDLMTYLEPVWPGFTTWVRLFNTPFTDF